jgi:hypothetical protein
MLALRSRPRIRIARDPLALLAVAALAAIAVEVALQRAVVPVAAHIPSLSGHAVVALLADVGLAALNAGALLVIVATIVVAAQGRRRAAMSLLVAVVVASTVVAAAEGGAAARFVSHAALAIALAAVVGARAGRALDAGALMVIAASAAVLAARLPLMLDAVGAGSPLRGAATAAEAAYLLVPLVGAAWLLSTRPVPAVAWWGAAVGGAVAAAAIAGSPGYLAMLTTWSLGVTLSLPLPLYIAGAAAALFVLMSWLRQPGARLAAAGLLLVAFAAVQPSLVHHNITALLGVLWLATAARPLAATSMSPAPATNAYEPEGVVAASAVHAPPAG